jgi:uncharacterized protein YhjY with autotransporter beta-barrel domain
MHYSNKTRLSFGVAGIAMAIGLSSPAHAACATDEASVTCTGDNVTDVVNASLAAVVGDDVSLVVVADTTVAQGVSDAVQPDKQGAVSITNAGEFGETALPVGIRYLGDPASPTNTFNLSNLGGITGAVELNGIGGATTINNAGSIDRGLFIGGSSSGPVTMTIGGVVNSSDPFPFALVANTRGSIDATISGIIGSPAVDDAPASLRDVALVSRQATSNATSEGPTTVAGVTTSSSSSSNSFAGSAVSLELAERAAAGSTILIGAGAIDAQIDGAIGGEGDRAFLFVDSSFVTNTFSSTTVTEGPVTTDSFENSSVTEGGAASVAIGVMGSVTGNVTAIGTDGSTIIIDGSVGSQDAPASVSASSGGTASSNEGSSTFNSDTGDSISQESSTAARNGGTASVTIGTTGVVSGSVSASGDAGATIANEGAIGGSASTNSSVVIESSTAETESSSTVVDPGVSTVTTLTESERTERSAFGGEALITNDAMGVIGGGVFANGLVAADVSNSGEIQIDVFVDSQAAFRSLDEESADQISTVLDDSSGSFSGQGSFSILDDVAGGTATLTNEATGEIGGGVFASGLAGANVVNAGDINENVNVTSRGEQSTSAGTFSTDILFDDMGNELSRIETSTSSGTTTQAGGEASLSNAAGGVIGDDPFSPVSVALAGTTGADLDNAGRINGNVSLNTRVSNSTFSSTNSSEVTADPDTLVLTEQENITQSSSQTTGVGGAASFENASGGLVVGNVSINADGGAMVDNAGIVIGTTSVTSSFTNSGSEFEQQDVTVTTPGSDGGRVRDFSETFSSFSNDVGGDISGTYAGANGALQFAPGTGASNGSVTQNTAGSSTATVTGSIFGNFTGNATGSAFMSESQSAFTETFDSDNDLISRTSDQSLMNETTANNGTSALTVDGGLISGSASLFATGDASASIIGGGEIGGALTLSNGAPSMSTFSEQISVVQNNDEDGNLVEQTTVRTFANSAQNGVGSSSAAISDGLVGGSVSLFSGAGGADLSVGADGQVGSTAQVFSFGTDNEFTETTISVETPDGTTSSTVSSSSNNAAGGDVAAQIAGVVGNFGGGAVTIDDAPGSGGGFGGLSLSTSAGNATANVSGQVLGFIDIVAIGSNSTDQSTIMSVDGDVTRETSSSTVQAVGGTASLVVNSSADNIADRNPAGFGSIFVAGMTGSSVEIGANSTVMAATGGSTMLVGSLFAFSDTTFASTTDNVANSGTSSFTSMLVGGPAILTNNGQIGNDGGNDFDGDEASVFVTSITHADAINNGSIFGSLFVNALGENFTETRSSINIGDVTRVDTVDRTYTAVGGNAMIDNNRLITGSVSVAAATGSLINDGVIRGGAVLGDSVENYATRSIDTAIALGNEEVTGTVAPFAQTYSLAQNGLLGQGVFVGGVFSDSDSISMIEGELITSDITAMINLNSGSVTGVGVVGEHDEATGERFTNTTVMLNGAGFLGLSSADAAMLGANFAAIDPQIAGEGDLSDYVGGARVLGVDSITKSGTGTFKIFGANYDPVSNINATADFTFDVGSFAIMEGEVQLGVANVGGSSGVFGLRGDLINSATLVLGERVTIAPQLFANNLVSLGGRAIDGIEIYQQGNFTQTGSGTIVVGMAPALVRLFPQTVGTGTSAPDILGFGGAGVSQGFFTTLDNVFDELGNSFVTIDGDLSLAGTVNVVAPRGGIFVDGQSLDLFSVSGTVTENASVSTGLTSAFISFDLASRVAAGRTIVSLGVSRLGYDSAALTDNGAAAGAALTAAIPGVVSALTADANGTGGFASVGQFALTQDMATVISGFDTLLSAAQAGAALEELASGEFFGSLLALDTTAPFADAITHRLLPEGAEGFNLWIQPSGDFTRLDGDSDVGSRKIRSDNYGGSAGFGVATGNGEFGLGFGYGRIDASAQNYPVTADAETYMVGAFGRFTFDAITIGADAVFGWSNWETSRNLPTFARTAEAEFDSREINANLRGEYRFDFSSAFVAPFAQVNLRSYKFEEFAEEGAGALGLIFEDADKTVITPEIGFKAGTSFDAGLATIRPEMTVSYAFEGDPDAFRDVAYAGAPDQAFRLNGVDPDGYITVGAGLFADIGRNSGAFVAGSYGTGGGNDRASINAGVKIGF